MEKPYLTPQALLLSGILMNPQVLQQIMMLRVQVVEEHLQTVMEPYQDLIQQPVRMQTQIPVGQQIINGGEMVH